MLTWEDDLEIHALHKRGWSISAIARHTKTNRRTVRNYLNGVTAPGVRKPAAVDGSDENARTMAGSSFKASLGRTKYSWIRLLK